MNHDNKHATATARNVMLLIIHHQCKQDNPSIMTVLTVPNIADPELHNSPKTNSNR
ncbi:predicted protein [Sclerotinia sclerotiorum 1980 UF-70]|uniref:Uncharacterized protein n=1 Tax=Sclerotinia sclerotiorum (strain ATCC 18683 / 1980 / Ss-1) TaxID=665079 RepID=A7EXX3_SCLS1|nr:predicted protein [Sclerotinia sclerotiorum 1980 UF-70]EDN94315.1 predicted protein [Sclerotinia sclerotiorum 1980 UF-70]